eukprot:Lithocolla_globosa_v1_NODE_20_length_9637_cov_33.687643.p1 type:complete len:527 gc:universal NODE_20_length_9637_cov_33.687643:5143-3563(-)
MSLSNGGTLVLETHTEPISDLTYNLGSASKRFNEIHSSSITDDSNKVQITSGLNVGTTDNSIDGSEGSLNIDGDITFYNATKNTIVWRQSGVGAPTLTNRSVGSKLVLYPAVSSSQVDYGIGIESGTLWFSTPNIENYFKWYGESAGSVFESMRLTNKILSPGINLGSDLGSGSLKWNKLYSDNITDDGTDVNVSSDFTASGRIETTALSGYKHNNLYEFQYETSNQYGSKASFPCSNYNGWYVSYAIVEVYSVGNSRTSGGGHQTGYIKGILKLNNADTSLYVTDKCYSGDDLSVHWEQTSSFAGNINVYCDPSNGYGQYPHCNIFIRIMVQRSGNVVSDPTVTSGTSGNPGANTTDFDIHEMGDINPLSDNNFKFGNTSIRWSQIHTYDIYTHDGGVHTSDENKKKDIVEFEDGLAFINELKPKKYKFIDGTSGRIHYGLTAQDLKKTIDKVGQDFGGYVEHDEIIKHDIGFDEEKQEPIIEEEIIKHYGIRYTELIAPMIKAIQELSQQNQDLISRIENLEKK